MNVLRSLGTFLRLTARHPRNAARFGCASARFFRDYLVFARRLARQTSPFAITGLRPMLADRHQERPTICPHYFYQDLYVARRVFQKRPERHVDVGSRIDGFVAHVAAFRPIEVLDIRDPGIRAPNIAFQRADILSDRFDRVDYCDSASCLHVLEHLGLGRYGDRLDPNGHVKGLDNLRRMLIPGGCLYLSVPIGEPRIEFHAHRVFSVDALLQLVESRFELEAFAYEDDRGRFFENVPLTRDHIAHNYGCHFGCAILELVKPR